MSDSKSKLTQWWNRIQTFFIEFGKADPFTYSSSIAFYTLFSMPAILYLLVLGAGGIYGEEAITGRLSAEINQIVGNHAAGTIEELLANVQREDQGIWATIVGIATLIVGSTTVFASIQSGLNQVWKVKASDDAGIIKILIDRMFSFTIVVSLGFLLVVSFVIDTALSYFSEYWQNSFPDITIIVAGLLNIVISMLVTGLLFTFIMKVLPDVKVTWKEAFVGGMATSLLFFVGKYFIGLYLGQSDLGSSYGAAGSLALLLVWVYYSALIILLGGKITQTYVKRSREIKATSRAVRFKLKRVQND